MSEIKDDYKPENLIALAIVRGIKMGYLPEGFTISENAYKILLKNLSITESDTVGNILRAVGFIHGYYICYRESEQILKKHLNKKNKKHIFDFIKK